MKIALTEDEALVLLDYLAGRDGEAALPVSHPSERVALWNLEAALERTVAQVLDPDYKALLLQARERLAASGGNPS